MSSSMFIESRPKPIKGGMGSDNEIPISGSADSNLVVVYGKKGVNFDKRGIENLIEEKALSSISVIRLTSPTPSMIDEEQEAEKTEELLRRQAEGLSDDDSNGSSSNNSTSADEGHTESEDLPTANDEQSEDGENSNDNGKPDNRKQRHKNKSKSRTSIKPQNAQNALHKERPDIVGLTIEQFYTPLTAKEVVKEALKLAGVSTIKHTADYEFQLYVIKNDHCYTPFTSPTQMKAQLAEKYKAEKHAIIGRKIIPHTAITMKQIHMKKKILHNMNDSVDQSTTQSGKEEPFKVINKSSETINKDEVDQLLEGDAEVNNSTPESDLDILSEESGDTDNDRDSDLDFDVNNRKGRKKKDLVTKAKRLSAGKVCAKRSLQNNEEIEDQRNKNIRPIVANIANRPIKVGIPSIVAGCAPPAVQKLLSDAVAALPPIPKRSATIHMEEKPMNTVSRQQQPMPSAIRRGPIIEVGMQKTSNVRTQIQSSPQSVKEIAINKVMASPKGGFTEIGELISQAEKQTPKKAAPTTPTSSHKALGAHMVSNPSPIKGFMPLGIETAVKNKLPAQISIQTHQSSSELAAKNKVSLETQHHHQPDNISSNNSGTQSIQKLQNTSDLGAEHFDLIVSIVKDEMQKNELKKGTIKPNANIPKLVQMLENAEHTMEANNSKSQLENKLSDFGASTDTTVDDIDISNAPLLDAPDGDDIPEDLLQHVVDLIEDDETLQEAVENQVFGGDNIEGILSTKTAEDGKAVLSPSATKTIQPSVPQAHICELESNQPKSIIEMAISNIPTTSIRESTSVLSTGVQTSKATQPIRKEPIQIVRGNGRVITLPPIEAPTTRAKRRAQNQPTVGAHGANSSVILNDSSLDNSLQSNSSFNVLEQPSQIVTENRKELPTKRRVSKESTTSGAAAKAKRSTARKSTTAKNIVHKSTVVEEATGSQEDDDDPNKLWCICRQPHNNRFMICCDVCEDWFHGTCVSITKAMGIEMEQKGIDWTCPKCLKVQEEKKQRKITEMLIPKKNTSNTSTERNEKEELEASNTSTASNMDATGGIADSSIDGNDWQKSDWLDIKQMIEPTTSQSEQTTPIKPPLMRKAIAITKAANSSQKKKQQSANTKNKTIIPQAKRRVPVLQQEQKNQETLQNKSTPTQMVPGTQQTLKDMQKSTAKETESLVSTVVEHTYCIVCKKVARPNSIYCSDDCIRKHAQNALNMFAAASASKPSEPVISICVNEENATKKKKPKGLFEDILSMADRKPKVERVNVIERKTGRVLTGSNAPTTLNLKKWLQDNQTFEVVQPGSLQAQEIEKKQKQRYQQSLSPVVPSTGKHITQLPQTSQTILPLPSLHAIPPSTKTVTQSQKENESATTQVQKPIKNMVEQIMKTTTNSPRPGTPKQLQKYPQVAIKPDKINRSDSKDETVKEKKEKSSKQRQSTENSGKKPPDVGTSTNSNSEPIRLNVRRTLKEQLLQRMNEQGSENENDNNLPKLSIEEIEKFVMETEAEMYEYFSRDTGSRYRAKYRSLMFNIKDRKNHTLFAKICAKKIQPKQLVRMSPEELASQELAKWRENEAKHQLEMIKKSELDLLSCTKNYVLKTHKGEEVIEGKFEDCVNLDVTIPVEDVVSVLNSSVVSSSNTIDDKGKSDLSSNSLHLDNTQNVEIQSTKITNRSEEEKQKNYLKEKEKELERDYERDRNRDHGRDREHSHTRARSHDSEHSREKHKKSRDKDRHRDKSRSRKRSRSHSRSRSRSREKRHKSHHKEEKREKEDRDREKERYKEKERDRERDSRSLKEEFEKKSVEKNTSENSNSGLNSNKINTFIGGKDKSSSKKATNVTKPIEAYSLIDQILESTKTVEEAANLISEKEKIRDREKEKQRKDSNRHVTTTPPLPTSSINSFASTEQNHSFSNICSNDDQEPTSTVSITTPPQDPYTRYADADSPTLSGNMSSAAIWSGNINMVDVASFHIVLQPVIGNSLNMGALLPDELDVVGRIGPDTVWEYISKIKRSPNKEIVIIRLIPASESETSAYTILFQYLENRNRLGVISTASPQIKDFYIYPLGAGKPMPPVLIPTEKVDFYEDPYRPDILVGVVVRIIGKRHSTVAAIATTSSVTKSFHRGIDADTFTPPGSPKRKRRLHASTPKVNEFDLDAIIKAPITTKSHKTSAIPLTKTDDANEPYSPGGSSDDDTLLISKPTSSRTDDDELKRKMDELNRQIAAQEKEIAGLLNVEPSCFTTTSSSKTSAVLANISIPSNLSQILASIKNKPEGNQAQSSSIHIHTQKTMIHSVTKIRNNLTGDEEYNPELALFGTSTEPKGKSSSRLAQLSEAELLSMVPDGIIDNPPVPKALPANTEIKPHFEEPPPPGV